MNTAGRPELVWPGKYDEQGNPRPVERTILPFQVIETINESKADREASQRDFFTKQAQDKTWRNRLIWGDNRIVMSSLLPELAGKIDLVYIDPPFATGQDFSFEVDVGDETVVKEASVIEEKAYRDTWGQGTSSYLQMMRERLELIRDLLSGSGALYLHVDNRMVHPLKLIADEVFGSESFLNHVIWSYRRWPGTARTYQSMHDDILFYAKDPKATRVFNIEYEAPSESYLKRFKGKTQVLDPETRSRKIVVDEPTKGLPVRDVWEISMIAGFKSERTGYPTQKPEPLLERVIRTSTDEGGLVADFFSGSGTTAAVAERLGRRWIACDLSKWAIQVARKRLLQVHECRLFEVQNLGHYERHKLAANGHGAWERYVKFILDLYRAEAVTGFKNLHGKKARAYVHVGSVDSPITMREIRSALEEARKSGMKEVHFLGWDFEMGLHDLGAEIQEEYGVKPRLVSIPKEALEVSNPAKEEVRFFDLNYLELDHDVRNRKLTVALKDFIIANPEYLPDEVRAKIKKFTDYVDYWAVDWDFKDDTFHNQWQSFRTRKEPKLETKATSTYEQAGKYKVLVKVVDVFGNDTTKLLEVTVK